jgi:hypothetical protein
MSQKRYSASGLVILLLIAGEKTLNMAAACDCAPPPAAREALKQASAVVLAKVIKIEDDPVTRNWKVTLQAERWWKGQGQTVTVFTIKSGAACGYRFDVGVRYLLYATSDGQRLYVNQCSRTRTHQQAVASGDFADLGEGNAP